MHPPGPVKDEVHDSKFFQTGMQLLHQLLAQACGGGRVPPMLRPPTLPPNEALQPPESRAAPVIHTQTPAPQLIGRPSRGCSLLAGHTPGRTPAQLLSGHLEAAGEGPQA